MKLKDYVILFGCSLLLGGTIVNSQTLNQPQDTTHLDTPIVVPVVNQSINVKGKKVLFIGDSHTANRQNGWQKQLSEMVGFDSDNVSVGGKTTYWMLEIGLYKIDDRYDYVFVYGGANDMYSTSISPNEAIENIKGIARMANKRGAQCIVLTGFDPIKCTRTPNPNYGPKYALFQKLLLTQDLDGAKVVDIRVVDRVDCWDGLCHMAPSGHKKIAEKIVKDLGFKKI